MSSDEPAFSGDWRSGAHQSSHAHLLAPVPVYLPGPRQPRLRLSAVVVPTSRPDGVGSGLALAARVAQAKDAQLVVIRSKEASSRPFRDVMVPRTTRPVAVIDLPPGAEAMLPSRSNEEPVATLHRDSDLGFKRNVGQLLARMCGWETLLYLDDDIRTTPWSAQASGGVSRVDLLARLEDVLAEFATYPAVHVAGCFQRDMDDNSVVCHVRRLVGRPQGVFISGGAMMVRAAAPLPMFSRAYNEDWLFFLPLILAGAHTLPSSAVKYIGTIHQDWYYPFSVPRARSEELGDLLAEGLFNLVGEPREDLVVTASKVDYWRVAVERRRQMIRELLRELYRPDGPRSSEFVDAELALQAALDVYRESAVDPAEALARFFTAFLDDQQEWDGLLRSVTPGGREFSLAEAIAALDLDSCVTWFGGDPDDTRKRAS